MRVWNISYDTFSSVLSWSTIVGLFQSSISSLDGWYPSMLHDAKHNDGLENLVNESGWVVKRVFKLKGKYII